MLERSKRLSTLRDVAQAAGVSIATASAVINRSAFVSAALEQRVRAAIAATGYRPDLLARALKKGAGRVLGLVVPDLTSPTMAALAHEISMMARVREYGVLLEVSGDDPRREEACLEQMRAHRVAGVLLVPAGAGPVYAAGLQGLLGAPAVLVERIVDGTGCDAVGIDHEAGTAAAVAHLVALGHRRIALLAGPAQASTTVAQLVGFRAALALRSVAFQPRLARIGPSRADHAEATARTLLAGAEPPTAVVAGSAAIALGVLGALGGQFSPDAALLCLEDADWMKASGLGAIVAAPASTAAAAVRLLFDRMAQPDITPRREAILGTLDPRRSCAAA